VNDTLIPPDTIPVNDNSRALSEAALTSLSKAVAHSFASINSAQIWVHNAIASLGEAKGIVDATDLGADLDASVNVLVVVLDGLCEAQAILESNCCAGDLEPPTSAADEDISEADEVAGYLAVGPSTSDRVIEGFIAAVGADRVFDALDRLTQPQNT
jgi:hypothetical protein